MGAIVAGGLTGLLNQSSAQVIDGSLKFDSGSSNYLNRTPSSAGNRKTWTWSGWVKRSKLGSGDCLFQSRNGSNTESTHFELDFTSDSISIGYGSANWLVSSAKFRDFSSFYHVVLAVDTTQSTASDRQKIYINGTRLTDFSTNTAITSNTDTAINNNVIHAIGARFNANEPNLNGYLADVHFIDGQALTHDSFGFTDPLTNTWRPKKYTGTFTGTNTFYLPMDNDDFHIDKSGNGNNWTKQNFSGTFNDPDVLKDSPSGAVSGGRAQTGITTTSSAPSNYATMNPLQMSPNRTPTLSDGNLTVSLSSGSSEWTNTGCTMNIGSGKYYWEVQFTTINGTIARIGVADSNNYEFNRNTASSGLPWLGSGTGVSWSLDVGGNTYYNGSTVNASYTSTIITSDIIGVLLDLDNNTLSFSKNGTNLGVAHSNVTSDFVTPGFGLHGGTTNTINVNFGQKPFKYAPPQGHLPLNSASATPETVITRPDHYVKTVLWTGNDVARSIVTGNAPDLVWIKDRSIIKDPVLCDSVRGAGETLRPDDTGANVTAIQRVSSFNSNGFSVGTDSGVNNNNDNFVGWTWKAGGNKNTFNVDDVGYASAAAAGLTGGDITPVAASVGTKQGFSIIQYQGNGSRDQSIPHGLTQAPDFSIIKNMDGTANWTVFHRSVTTTNQKVFYLNTTAAVADYSNGSYTWWHQLPGASLFYIGDLSTAINNGTNDMISYHWHDVPGLQKFGKYIGNVNPNGPFIELGFRPSVIIIKRSDGGTENWTLWDASRNPTNVMGKQLYPNLNAAEADAGTNTSYGILDFVSNGVKIRGSHTSFNSDGHTFIYAAWAEAPTFNLYGGQSNAR